ncbi:transglycosylase SLT domain-containing protein [Streptomyces sp. NPDC056707]|uniref:transglycosylase SLT domain-containing protein n=1 Tax=Streptomyces sp. NPDC056707 TaxID=3345919 RepID=UPI00367C40A6
MSSVGSVSLRVSPDVTRFGQELSQRLRAETTSFSIPIEIDGPSIANFRAQVANLTRPVVLPVQIQLDRASIATYRAQVANLIRPQTADININLQGEAAARARLDALAQNRTSNVRVDVDRGAAATVARITSAASSAMGMVAGLGSKLAMLGSAAPAVGAVVNVVAAIAPAAALALPAVAAIGSAVGAIKLGTAGLGDAFKEAFNPTTPEAFAAVMAKLSPQARALVTSVTGLKSAWDAMQFGVQDRLLAGVGGRLSDVGSRVIPILRGGLEGTAGVLNRMAKGALDAVNNLARAGMLKQIFDGAAKSLSPLSRIPGQLVTGFGQVAVAAQPAFQRITDGVAGAADGISAKLAKAFESGAMEKAINTAVTLLGDLMDVAGNVMDILGDIFMAGEGTGGGTIGVLKTITAEISKITSSPEVQGGLKALFSVMGTLATTVAPLLGTALKFVGQIFEKLGPPVEILVKALGDALTPVIDALGPVLVIVADVLGKILVAISPLIVVIGELLATALKPLGPIFEVIGKLIEKLAPVIAILADALGQILTPILEGLGEVLIQVVSAAGAQFMAVIEALLPVIPKLIPPLVSVGKCIGDLLLAIAPLLPQLLSLGTELAITLLPAILPLIPPIVQLVELLVRFAAWAIEKYALPALQKLIDFFHTMKKKFQPLIDAVRDATEWIAEKFQLLHDKLVDHSLIPDVIKKLREWFDKGKTWIKEIWDKLWDNTVGRAERASITVTERVLGFVQGVRDKFNDAKRWVKEKWDDLWTGVSDRVTSMRKTVEGKVKDFKDNIVGFFKGAIEGVRTVWDKLQDISKKPVKFMIETVFNKGIVRVWNNTAAKLPGIGKMDEMKLPKAFASGGILPGYTPGKDVHRFYSPTGGLLDLSGGEAIMRPEVTQAVGEQGINTLNAAARQGGIQGVRNVLSHQAFAGGGIWDAITDNPVTNTVGSILGKGADWARGGVADLAEKALKALLGPLKIPAMRSPDWTDLMKVIPVQVAKKMVSFIRGKEDSGAGSDVALKGYKPSAGVAQWSSVVLQSLKEVGEPASLLNTTLRRMNQESGGNPTIVNKWDSNWQAGHPSVGLMQVIGPTFRSYAGKYRNKGPFLYGTSVDPLANVYSSMRYAKAAYGSLSRAYNRAGGYDNGGWLPQGVSTVVNQTGQPEAILNPQQWQSMVTLAEQAKRGQAGGHQIVVNNPPERTGEKQVAGVLYRMDLLGR